MKFNATVMLVGGGARDSEAFDMAHARSEILLAADGGADEILQMGHIPQAVFGDMDSLSDAAKAAIPDDRLHSIAEQDSTDFDKALRMIAAPLILAVGFSGARLDHELAALHGLVRYPDRAVIVIGPKDITFHVPAHLSLRLEPGSRLSLFPMDAVRVSATGLDWSFESLEMHPARKIGTSNRVSAGAVTVDPSGPGLLMILPRAALDAAIVALSGLDFPSPRG